MPLPGLRERKSAKQKIGIAETMMELLEQKPLEAITVREICEQLEISEATFFNYFPRKQDVLGYFIQLWSIEVGWMARQLGEEEGGLKAIESIFATMAQQIMQFPAFMGEMIAHQARLREWSSPPEIGLAERLQAFPDMPGVEDIAAEGLDGLLSEHLRMAIDKGELPAGIDLEVAILGLVSLFYGIPMMMRLYDSERIAPLYVAELQLFWHGLRKDNSN